MFINLFKDYFSVNNFNELENPFQNSVTHITHYPVRKVPEYRIILIKSYNNLSRKGPLEVIYSNPQFRACVIRPGCSRTCLVESRKSLRAEIPKAVWLEKNIQFKLQVSKIIPPLQRAHIAFTAPHYVCFLWSFCWDSEKIFDQEILCRGPPSSLRLLGLTGCRKRQVSTTPFITWAKTLARRK